VKGVKLCKLKESKNGLLENIKYEDFSEMIEAVRLSVNRHARN